MHSVHDMAQDEEAGNPYCIFFFFFRNEDDCMFDLVFRLSYRRDRGGAYSVDVAGPDGRPLFYRHQKERNDEKSPLVDYTKKEVGCRHFYL